MDRDVAEGEHAHDRGGAHRIDAPQPQQHGEEREHHSRGGEGEVAEQPVGADGRDRLAADHGKADHDDQRTVDARPRQMLLEHHCCEKHPREGGAGRLDDAAMAERHQEEAGGAHHREARSAEHRERDPAAPADAVEVAQAVAHHARQEGEARPHVAMKHEVERREPDL